MTRSFKLPTTLAVTVLWACTTTGSPDAGATPADAAMMVADASMPRDAAITDAAPSPDAAGLDAGRVDAGCQVFEVYDPVTGMCYPVA